MDTVPVKQQTLPQKAVAKKLARLNRIQRNAESVANKMQDKIAKAEKAVRKAEAKCALREAKIALANAIKAEKRARKLQLIASKRIRKTKSVLLDARKFQVDYDKASELVASAHDETNYRRAVVLTEADNLRKAEAAAYEAAKASKARIKALRKAESIAQKVRRIAATKQKAADSISRQEKMADYDQKTEKSELKPTIPSPA